MKQLLSKLPFLVTLYTALLLSTPTFCEPPNLTLLKNEIKKYHDSGRYERELASVIKKAQKYIFSQVLINQQRKEHLQLAVVLDIDETSLSNYHYMIKRDFTGTRAQFHKDIMAADDPAIKPTLALYKEMIRHGVSVFFVTGRSKSLGTATKNNLIKDGYTRWSGLYLRPNHYTYNSIIPFKSRARKLITQKGYTIVASIGDQYSDLKGGYAEKGFKLPNPYYYLP